LFDSYLRIQLIVIQPAGQVSSDETRHHVHMPAGIVEARYVAKAIPSVVEEDLPIQLVDLFEGLETIDREAGTDDIQMMQTGFRQ
jgi:hypothetical protein